MILTVVVINFHYTFNVGSPYRYKIPKALNDPPQLHARRLVGNYYFLCVTSDLGIVADQRSRNRSAAPLDAKLTSSFRKGWRQLISSGSCSNGIRASRANTVTAPRAQRRRDGELLQRERGNKTNVVPDRTRPCENLEASHPLSTTILS